MTRPGHFRQLVFFLRDAEIFSFRCLPGDSATSANLGGQNA